MLRVEQLLAEGAQLGLHLLGEGLARLNITDVNTALGSQLHGFPLREGKCAGRIASNLFQLPV